MRFLVQPDGVYLSLEGGSAILLPNATFDPLSKSIDISAIPISVSVDGVIIERAVGINVDAGIVSVVLEDLTSVEAAVLIDYAKRSGTTMVDATKTEIENVGRKP